MNTLRNAINYGFLLVIVITLSSCGGSKPKEKQQNNPNIIDIKEGLSSYKNIFSNSLKQIRSKNKKSLDQVETTSCGTGYVESRYDDTLYWLDFNQCQLDLNDNTYLFGGAKYLNGYTYYSLAYQTDYIYSLAGANIQLVYDQLFTNKSIDLFDLTNETSSGFFNLNATFDTPVYIIYLNGSYSYEYDVSNDFKETLKSELTDINQSGDSTYIITGNDLSGTEWKKMNISYEVNYKKTQNEALYQEKNILYSKFSIDTNKRVFTQNSSTHYAIKTITPFKSHPNKNYPSSGKMSVYNSEDNTLSKLSVIDTQHVEISIDFDNDGDIDITEKMKWTEIF